MNFGKIIDLKYHFSIELRKPKNLFVEKLTKVPLYTNKSYHGITTRKQTKKQHGNTFNSKHPYLLTGSGCPEQRY
jgi:hypothetical protein